MAESGREIGDPNRWVPMRKRRESIAPDVGIARPPSHRAVRGVYDHDVFAGILDIRLEELRIAWVGQDLIDATGPHDVSAEKQRHRPRLVSARCDLVATHGVPLQTIARVPHDRMSGRAAITSARPLPWFVMSLRNLPDFR